MEELSQAVSDILSSEEGRQNLKSVADLLGLSLPEGLFSSDTPASPPEKPAFSAPPGDLSGLLPLLGGLNQEDDSIRLLKALKPLLRDGSRVDSAIRLMRLYSLLPLLSRLPLLGEGGDSP